MFGGYGDDTTFIYNIILNTCNNYNNTINQWLPLTVKHISLSTVQINNTVYIIGGFNEQLPYYLKFNLITK